MTASESKKLGPRARKQMQRNAEALKRHIALIEKELEVRKALYAFRTKPENYELATDFVASMKYQRMPEHLELSRQLEEIRYNQEIITLEMTLQERKETLEGYTEALSARE